MKLNVTRDISIATSSGVPIIGVPTNVKVFSSTYSRRTRAVTDTVDVFVQGTELTEEEILDFEEVVFREYSLDSKLLSA